MRAGWIAMIAAAAVGLGLALACGGPPRAPMVPDTDVQDAADPSQTTTLGAPPSK